MAKCPADFDFFAPEVIESPFEFYSVLREQAPVYLLPGTNIYMLSRLDDIRQAAKDTETFSSDFRHLLQGLLQLFGLHGVADADAAQDFRREARHATENQFLALGQRVADA